jgi:hypothetical protein
MRLSELEVDFGLRFGCILGGTGIVSWAILSS